MGRVAAAARSVLARELGRTARVIGVNQTATGWRVLLGVADEAESIPADGRYVRYMRIDRQDDTWAVYEVNLDDGFQVTSYHLASLTTA